MTTLILHRRSTQRATTTRSRSNGFSGRRDREWKVALHSSYAVLVQGYDMPGEYADVSAFPAPQSMGAHMQDLACWLVQ